MPSRNRHREARRHPEERCVSVDLPPGAATNGGTSATAGRTPAGVRRVHGSRDAEWLAGHLLDPGRSWPVVVVSIPSSRTEPLIDVDDLAQAVRGIAEVVLLPTDETSWRLSELLPAMTQVYGGAGRVYPVGLDWTTDPYVSPLRFCFGEHENARATERLVSDALTMGADHARGRAEAEPSPIVAGVVAALVAPSRAMVSLDDDGVATVWQELTAPGVPLDQLLRRGMRVQGRLDRETRRLDVTAALRAGVTAVAHYAAGDVVLARVERVRPDMVHLALHPDVVVPVPAAGVTGNPKDRLTDLFTKGETVVTRVVSGEGGRFRVRLDDLVDDVEPLTAPALLQGGPPWLVPPPDPEVPEPVLVPSVNEQPPTPAIVQTTTVLMPRPSLAVRDLSLTLDAAKAELHRVEGALATAVNALRPAEAERDALRRQLTDLVAEQQRLREQVERQRTQLRKRATSAAARKRPEATPDDDALAFIDPVDQLRHDIYLRWVARIPAADKSERPMREYTVGPEFVTSLDAVEGVTRQKILDVVVEVLTGLAEQSGGRELHRLRRGQGGDDSPIIRVDGAVAWRVAIQRNTPAARRLHFWRLGDHVELSRVVLHDDVEP
ncbi:hypothetical protein N866_01030 [Actinotalea ferrariae CF5-4]|uniref:S1 motif domain-containing protein n=1 Tax=Actinotalea ferrariae CF5-4 TaxID=948458 RepID=A0A021VQJ5_9CELL|nr:hypothetical protein [Actinotalea ferrariae]EYR63388.1 hypothetical protein N866_01030 [Actinotalea ferrariae CF5-4]